jgi:trigger factor
LEYTKEILPQSRVKFKITLSEKDLKKYYESAYQRLATDIEVRGFRKGKAPRGLAEKQIGSDKIFSEALDKALPEIYHEIIHQEKLIPIQQPEIKIKEFDPKKPLIFICSVDILPEVTLPNYKNIKVKKSKMTVSEKELAQGLENIRQSYADLKEVKRAAKKGDKIEIDFEGFLKHVKIDSLVSKNHPVILGQTKLIPGFTEKLIGLKTGDEKTFKLKMPKDVKDQLVVGKEVEFKIKVKKVEEIIYPEINKTFIKKISKFKDVKEFEESLKKSILSQKEIEEERRLQNEVIKKIAEKTKIEIPESLVEAELANMIEDLSKRIEAQGGTLDNWLASIKKTREDFSKELRTQAEESVKINLVVSQIRLIEKIKVDEKEIDEEIKMLKLRGQEVPDDESTRRYVGNILGNRKVVKMLVERASRK